ncbi:NAD(P)-binding domain-containing protein [Streptomyces sp. t39]|uniref:NAD(P)-binding domain-containing protein n=1 Tax=Streptomyces sp. t39 TaxID=1828156 RepID=UPI0011CE6DB1|nr:NAD(P)-binding domain-containing protein [Streptomyces sp. t39]TXS56656.1 dimethylaniline monooxygenase [Streptomyces sp. t39]
MHDLAVIGAGPYGLSVAAHAAAAGIDVRVFGRVMDSWRHHMPEGMYLKSEPWSSNLSHPGGEHTLGEYAVAHGGFEASHGRPVPVGTFADYGGWFAGRAVPAVDERTVTRLVPEAGGFVLRTGDGEEIRARTVALAVGVLPFREMPDVLAPLPAELCSHSTGHGDLGRFAGTDVTVVGAGQAALETAALLAEAGARPQLVARARRIRWNTLPAPLERPLLTSLRTPHSGLGTGWSTWVWAELPWAVRRLPAATRRRRADTALGPAGAWWLRERYEGRVPELLGHVLRGARVRSDGRVRLELRGPDGTARALDTGHVVAATGFTPDLTRLELLDDSLGHTLRLSPGTSAPELSGAFETSHPGLFVAGLLSAPTFGPAMRFVHGASWAAPRLVAGVRRRLRGRTGAIRVPRPATAPGTGAVSRTGGR